MVEEAHTVPASIFEGVASYVAAKGFSFGDIAAEVGLPSDVLKQPDARVSMDTVAAFFDRAAIVLGEPDLGLRLAEIYPPGASGVVGQLVLHAPTVRDALYCIERYTTLLLEGVEVSFTEEGGTGLLVWRYPPSYGSRLQLSLFLVGSAALRLRGLAGPSWVPLRVELEHRDLDETSLLLRLVGPRVRFNCARNAMVIDGATLNKVNSSSNLRLYTLLRELAERLLSEQQASTDIVQRISSEIEVRLPGGAFDLESIAKAMGLTQRSVRTRLATSETSFSTILDQTRQRLATQYLIDTDLPLSTVSHLLGFSELSAFTRAARRWYGEAPRSYRQKARASHR